MFPKKPFQIYHKAYNTAVVVFVVKRLIRTENKVARKS